MLLAALFFGLRLTQLDEFAPPETPVRPELFQKPTYGPKLSEVDMTVRVRGKPGGSTATVSLPVPNDYTGQAVIGFQVTVDPPAALQNWHWAPTKDGLNDVVQVSLAASDGAIAVGYRAIVATPGFGVVRTQKKDFYRWLAPTALIDSGDPDIVAVAKKLQTGNPSRSGFAKRVVKWVAANHLRAGPEKPVGEPVTAKAALAAGGDSRGRSDLCAALLRAGGIAARTMAVAPFWIEGAGCENWLVEYASDDNCWEMLEPTIGLQFPVRNTQIVLWVLQAYLEGGPAGSVGPTNGPVLTDAPYLPGISPGLQWASEAPKTPTTVIRVMRTFPMQSGARLMIAAQRRHTRVVDAAKSGTASWIDERLLTRILAKGPINLALFLDGKSTMPDSNGSSLNRT